MSEIKPVYQLRVRFNLWEDQTKEQYEDSKFGDGVPRILYPAAAYEALQKDLGLAKLAFESKRDLLTSCEAALEQSQSDNAALQKENAELKEKLRYSVMAADAEARFADEYKFQSEAQAKQIEQQLEAIEATADFAKEFWKKADTDSRTRIMVQTFKTLESKLRTYLPASKNGE